jgi:hypothetical protein
LLKKSLKPRKKQGAARWRTEMLKSKTATGRWIILDSFPVSKLNETPSMAKRTSRASQFSPLEDVRILQSGERALEISICR